MGVLWRCWWSVKGVLRWTADRAIQPAWQLSLFVEAVVRLTTLVLVGRAAPRSAYKHKYDVG